MKPPRKIVGRAHRLPSSKKWQPERLPYRILLFSLFVILSLSKDLFAASSSNVEAQVVNAVDLNIFGAANFVTGGSYVATITVTNAPNGLTNAALTVNGVTWTWTNALHASIPANALRFGITNSFQQAATNIFGKIQSVLSNAPLNTISFSIFTNTVKITGLNNTAIDGSVSGAWARLTIATNAPAIVPIGSGGAMGGSNNIQNVLAFGPQAGNAGARALTNVGPFSAANARIGNSDAPLIDGDDAGLTVHGNLTANNFDNGATNFNQICALIAAGLPGKVIAGATLYVRTNGTPAGLRDRLDAPFNHPTNALAAAQAGDTIDIVGKYFFRTNATVTVPANVNLRGPAELVASQIWSGAILQLTKTNTLTDLTFSGVRSNCNGGVFLAGGTNSTIQHCTFNGFITYDNKDSGSTNWIDDCVFTGFNGVHAQGSGTVTIAKNCRIVFSLPIPCGPADYAAVGSDDGGVAILNGGFIHINTNGVAVANNNSSYSVVVNALIDGPARFIGDESTISAGGLIFLTATNIQDETGGGLHWVDKTPLALSLTEAGYTNSLASTNFVIATSNALAAAKLNITSTNSLADKALVTTTSNTLANAVARQSYTHTVSWSEPLYSNGAGQLVNDTFNSVVIDWAAGFPTNGTPTAKITVPVGQGWTTIVSRAVFYAIGDMGSCVVTAQCQAVTRQAESRLVNSTSKSVPNIESSDFGTQIFTNYFADDVSPRYLQILQPVGRQCGDIAYWAIINWTVTSQ
jgi:hypothetical protein